jgi:hypothetical protein
MRNPFRCFNSSPEVIRLTVMMYIRYPLSLRQVEDLLFERGLDICHETVREAQLTERSCQLPQGTEFLFVRGATRSGGILCLQNTHYSNSWN